VVIYKSHVKDYECVAIPFSYSGLANLPLKTAIINYQNIINHILVGTFVGTLIRESVKAS